MKNLREFGDPKIRKSKVDYVTKNKFVLAYWMRWVLYLEDMWRMDVGCFFISLLMEIIQDNKVIYQEFSGKS